MCPGEPRLGHGLRAATPIAIIERGYTADQRSIFSILDRVVYDAAAASVTSPAVLVIGEVVAYARLEYADAAAVLNTAALLVPAE